MINCDEKNSGWNSDFRDPEAEAISKLWEYEAGGKVTTPVISNDYVCAGSRDFKIHAITAGNGNEDWTFQFPSLVNNSAAIQNGVVLVAPDDEYISGLTLSQGRRNKQFVRSGSTPIVDNGKVYFTSFDDGGGIYCYSQESAELLWKVDLNPRGPPAVGEENVFVSGQDGEVYAIDKSEQDILWQVETVEGTESVQLEPPAVSGSTVFVGHSGMGEGKLYAINTEDGNERWKHTVTSDRPEDRRPPLAVRSYVCNKNSVFFASKFEVSMVDKKSGSFRWTTSFNGVVNDLALSDNWLYAIPYGDGIYRTNLANGEKSQVVQQASSSSDLYHAISLANGQIITSRGKKIISYSDFSIS
jgi:outer membrane protein assembly factor BamB